MILHLKQRRACKAWRAAQGRTALHPGLHRWWQSRLLPDSGNELLVHKQMLFRGITEKGWTCVTHQKAFEVLIAPCSARPAENWGTAIARFSWPVSQCRTKALQACLQTFHQSCKSLMQNRGHLNEGLRESGTAEASTHLLVMLCLDVARRVQAVCCSEVLKAGLANGRQGGLVHFFHAAVILNGPAVV